MRKCCYSSPGFSDTNRKFCEFIKGKGCIENYKYCSDYRAVGVNEDTAKEICERIRPYNSDGTFEEKDYKCVYDTSTGCQKIKKTCAEAQDGTQCSNLCTTLTNPNTYYAYVNGQCIMHYTTCANAPTNPTTKCTGNIPINNVQCEVNPNDSTKCKDKTVETGTTTVTCSSYSTEENKINLCESITSNICYYSRTLGCTSLTSSCSEYLKSDFPSLDEEFCIYIKASDNKICSLKADGSGCEEKNREPICPEQPTPELEDQNNPENQCYASRLRVIGVELIAAILCLLI